MNYLEFLIELREQYKCIPMSTEQLRDPTTNKGSGYRMLSNSELRRLMSEGAILFNGAKVDWMDEVVFPITSLVFFQSGKKRTTLR